jgi:benzoylformate decarboxylase
MPRGRDVLVGVLEQLELPLVFGTPGGIDVSSGLRQVEAPDAGIAIGMAVGFARGSGRVGVVFAQGTLAAESLHVARRARAPLVVFAPDGVDLDEPGPAYEVRSADELGATLRRAFVDAVAPPAGPVLVVLADEGLEASVSCVPRLNRVGWGLRADELELARGGALLAGAENPVIVAGDGAGLGDAWPELVTLAERMGAPVFTEADSTALNFPNRHDQWLGETANIAQAVQHADVALLCGLAPATRIDRRELEIIQVTDDAGQLARQYPIAAGIFGDVKLNLMALGSALRATSQPRSAAGAANRRRAALAQQAIDRRAEWDQRVQLAREQPSVTPVLVAAELAALLPRDAIFCHELDATTRAPFMQALEIISPRAYYGGRLAAAAAIGLHLAQPQRPVLCALTAHAFSTQAEALRAAAHLATGSIVFVIIGPSRDLALIGMESERVGKSENVRPALERAVSAGKPCLVHVDA